MKLTVDYEADALYLQLNDSRIVDSEEVAPGVVLDYNENDRGRGSWHPALTGRPRAVAQSHCRHKAESQCRCS